MYLALCFKTYSYYYKLLGAMTPEKSKWDLLGRSGLLSEPRRGVGAKAGPEMRGGRKKGWGGDLLPCPRPQFHGHIRC